jgi:Flp pilus assembly protein TadG
MRRTVRDDRGTMALEMVLLTPLMITFILALVGLGRVVEAQSQVDGAARDAARAASLSRTRPAAQANAHEAANLTLTDGKKHWCQNVVDPSVDFSQWRRGGQVSVAVSCKIDLTGLSLAGFLPSPTMTGTATAPIDTLRRLE